MPNLTELVGSPRNPVGQFCRTRMPGRTAVQSANRMLSEFTTTRPEGDGKGYPYMLIGTAFDYRMRMFFDPEFNFEGTIALGRATGGVVSLPGCENTAWFLWNGGDGLSPEQRNDDDHLGQLCIIAAYLEDVWRRGVVGEWFLEAERMTAEQLLSSIPSAWVGDIAQMAGKLELAFSDWKMASMVSNPTLGRAELDIGADGDLILDDCLIDIKVTVSAKVTQIMLHQVVCYALLDHDDRFGIRKVGLYLARQGALMTWPLPELLEELGVEVPISELRASFEEAAHQVERA